jgi:hypothetical protein
MKKTFRLPNIIYIFTEQIVPKLQLPKEFAVKIDDCGSLYLKSLINILKTKSVINKTALQNLETGDTVVFTKNEVYVEDCVCTNLGSNITKLSLVKDYSKVEKSIDNFFKNVFKKVEKPSCCDYCKLQPTCFNTNKDRIYDGQYISIEEKVSIMYNFVKVGYEQYDIVELCNGKKYVTIEDEEFEVKKDRLGNKYLQLQ